MSKRTFSLPVINFSGDDWGGEGGFVGGGSGQGGTGTNATPMSYTAWLASDYAEDVIQNDIIDEYDYAAWWMSNHFSQSDWEDLNPGLDWYDYFD